MHQTTPTLKTHFIPCLWLSYVLVSFLMTKNVKISSHHLHFLHQMHPKFEVAPKFWEEYLIAPRIFWEYLFASQMNKEYPDASQICTLCQQIVLYWLKVGRKFSNFHLKLYRFTLKKVLVVKIEIKRQRYTPNSQKLIVDYVKCLRILLIFEYLLSFSCWYH